MFHDDNEENVDRALADERRAAADEQRPDAAADALSATIRRRSTELLAHDGPFNAARGRGGRARHLRARRDRLGRRGPRRRRGARRVLARRDDRPRSEPALRRAGDDGDEDLRPADGVAELDPHRSHWLVREIIHVHEAHAEARRSDRAQLLRVHRAGLGVRRLAVRAGARRRSLLHVPRRQRRERRSRCRR